MVASPTRRDRPLEHPCDMRAERELVPFATERVDAWARFDTFIEEEHEAEEEALRRLEKLPSLGRKGGLSAGAEDARVGQSSPNAQRK